MTAWRRAGAIGTGLVQLIVGLILALLSIESIGLVSDEEFSVSWPLAVPALFVLGTIGFTVAFVTQHPRWFRTGLVTAVLAGAGALLASVVVGSLAAGMLLLVLVQLVLPVLLPAGPGPLGPRHVRRR